MCWSSLKLHVVMVSAGLEVLSNKPWSNGMLHAAVGVVVNFICCQQGFVSLNLTYQDDPGISTLQPKGHFTPTSPPRVTTPSQHQLPPYGRSQALQGEPQG